MLLLGLRAPILPKLAPRPQARHYARGTIAIETGVEGASASGVTLDRAMLTHFRIAPHAVFTEATCAEAVDAWSPAVPELANLAIAESDQ